MNKGDMVEIVRREANVTVKVAQTVVDELLGVMVDRVFAGEKVSVRGFGVFSLKTTKAREFRNPTGKGGPIKVGERKTMKFKASTMLRD